jgi:hypothetical protein
MEHLSARYVVLVHLKYRMVRAHVVRVLLVLSHPRVVQLHVHHVRMASSTTRLG